MVQLQKFPSPCGVKKLKRQYTADVLRSQLVSVPLRGKKIETTSVLPDGTLSNVSVPLRGKKIETNLETKIYWVSLFPSPCGVKNWNVLQDEIGSFNSQGVSVPLRGKKIETWFFLGGIASQIVSVPLRGKKFETNVTFVIIYDDWASFRPLAG